MKEEYIKEYSTSRIIGIIQTESNGNAKAIDFSTRCILGYYDARRNVTMDTTYRCLYYGNMLAAFFVMR